VNRSKNSILVIGDVMLDHYIEGSVSRISPEAPVPVLRYKKDQYRLGGASNVALNLKGLSANVGILGIVGNDNEGKIFNESLINEKINSHIIKIDSYTTIVKRRYVSKGHQLIRVDYENQPSPAVITDLDKVLKDVVHHYSTFIFSDYNKGSLLEVGKMIRFIKNEYPDSLIVVDPKGNNYHKYEGADLVTPNINEFKLVMGGWSSDEELYTKAKDFLNMFNIKYLLLTRSEDGMSLFYLNDSKFEKYHFDAEAKEVFDVTGAGDTVIATLADSLSSGMNIFDSILRANKAAGIVVSKFGTSKILDSELD
jgi:rfaE bifunctional protein kinase chain/domain